MRVVIIPLCCQLGLELYDKTFINFILLFTGLAMHLRFRHIPWVNQRGGGVEGLDPNPPHGKSQVKNTGADPIEKQLDPLVQVLLEEGSYGLL